MKKKRTDGYLTVEAPISLTIFWFFMMFIMNMGQIYRAQNCINHGMLQTGKMLAFASYDYNHYSISESIIDNAAQLFNFHVGNEQILYNAWQNADYESAVKRAFGYCADVNPQKTNETLKRYGLVDGMDSIEFMAVSVGGDLDIAVKYDIELPFAFFGFDHVTMHQQVKCGLWS